VDDGVSASLDGWIPFRLSRSEDRLIADWCYLGEFRLTEPFFEDSLRRAFRQSPGSASWRQTPADVLIERTGTHPGIGPDGFIFHMSRCGSTLIAQMLAASKRNVVISEAPPVHSALYAEELLPAISDEKKIALLRGVIHALGQTREGGEQRYFVKLDCWHALDLGLVRRAFPDVPWVFVYRDPVEVLASQARVPAAWTVPGMVTMHGIDLSPVEYATNRMEYAARILARICESALVHVADGGLPVNYADLPDAVFHRIASHFGCTWDEDEAGVMRKASRLDAKSRHDFFVPDGGRKREAASVEVREMVARFLTAVFERLRSSAGMAL
jgi:hypothetical protein